ncbi:hypothetical protein HDV00_003093 [Rhizophlyctis rosea]|nr:hypothetical protein HDV00_003093 [Rhizophlyctis rosea]
MRLSVIALAFAFGGAAVNASPVAAGDVVDKRCEDRPVPPELAAYCGIAFQALSKRQYAKVDPSSYAAQSTTSPPVTTTVKYYKTVVKSSAPAKTQSPSYVKPTTSNTKPYHSVESEQDLGGSSQSGTSGSDTAGGVEKNAAINSDTGSDGSGGDDSSSDGGDSGDNSSADASSTDGSSTDGSSIDGSNTDGSSTGASSTDGSSSVINAPATTTDAGSNGGETGAPSSPTTTSAFNSADISAASAAQSSGLSSKSAAGIGASVAIVGVAALVVAGLIIRRRRSNAPEPMTPPTKYYGFDDHSAKGGFSNADYAHPECKPNYPDISYTNPRSVHSERSITPVRPAPTPQPLPSLSRSSFLSLSSLPVFAGGYGPRGGTLEREFNQMTFNAPPTPPALAPIQPTVVPAVYPESETRYDINMEDMTDSHLPEPATTWAAAAVNPHDSLRSLEELAVSEGAVTEFKQQYQVLDAAEAANIASADSHPINNHYSVYTDGAYDGRNSIISDYRDSMMSEGYNRDSVMSYDSANYRDSVMTTATDATFDNDVLAAHFAQGDNMQSSILAALNHMGANVEGEAGAVDVPPAPSVAASSEMDDGTLARRI